VRTFEGDLVVKAGSAIAIVVSRFNDTLTTRMLDGAVETYRRHGGNPDELTVAYVPGSFELSVAALKLARTGRYQAVVCLGCVVRGSTGHYDQVANGSAGGISQAAMASGVPVIFGVITADTLEQALERSGTKQGNQGSKAMLAAVEMVNLFNAIDQAHASSPQG
jgi:6,7-dimethyl-8-ribityllumazine synthase